MKSHRSLVLTRSIATATSLAVAAGFMLAAPAQADPDDGASPVSPVVTPTPPPAKPIAPCATKIPNVANKYWKKVPKGTKQAVVVEGRGMKSYSSKTSRWEKVKGCWLKLSTYETYNGNKGWAIVPWTGGQRSPIGTYRLTDAGGRLRNPGTKMRYHYGPKSYAAGGYGMSQAKLQIFDYVVAVNYNRKAGTTPRANRVLDRRKASGYWFHVRRAFPTRGCVSMSRPIMKQLTQWLDPAKKPVTIQGPKSVIYS